MVEVIGYVLLGLVVLLGFIAVSQAGRKPNAPDDSSAPNDSSAVYVDQLLLDSRLTGHGRYLVRVYRRNGDVHSEAEVVGDAAEAVAMAVSAFRRAGILAVDISEDTVERLCFRRLSNDPPGAAEGRQVNAAEISRIG